jgi:hypothetical protein
MLTKTENGKKLTSALPPSVDKLRKDVRAAAAVLKEDEVRYLVDAYYIMQDDRKRARNQERAYTKANEGEVEKPSGILGWLAGNSELLEDEIKTVLDVYSENHPIGKWLKSNVGIGPVIAAGLLAHIKIDHVATAGHIWRFAGLDPTVKWEKGKKRPWNAALRTLCWKVGQSFMKFSGHEDCVYGHLYRQRKVYEVLRNGATTRKVYLQMIEEGVDVLPQVKIADDLPLEGMVVFGEKRNAETARTQRDTRNYKKGTIALKWLEEDVLPPGQIDARARRWATKLFLSDLHVVWYFHHHGKMPPLPYPVAILGHAHRHDPPNAKIIKGLPEALKAWR